MHYMPLNLPPSYPISAIYKNTTPQETSPWVMPGTYTAKLTVNGQTFSQPLIVKMDPRVKTPAADLQKQHDMSFTCYESRKEIMSTLDEISHLHIQIKALLPKASGELTVPLRELDKQVAALENRPLRDTTANFDRLNNAFINAFNILEQTDMPPTAAVSSAVTTSKAALKQLQSKWMNIKDKELPKLNEALKKAGLEVITL
jgi:hypothetical protein